MSKKVMLIVTEGQTDTEFYEKMLQYIKNKGKIKRFPFDKINFVCAKGIGNLEKKIINIIKNKLFIPEDMKDTEKTIVLCYDLDVFEFNQNPPIDREKVVNDIKELGECKIIRIEAKNMIEDFFLFDFEGIRECLRLKKTYKLKAKGYEGIKKMFKDCGKIYFKGDRAACLIDNLNMEIIFSNIKNELRDLCKALGYEI